MASARARWALLLLLALASAHVASAAWGKKAEPAADKVVKAAAKGAAAADANAGRSHKDETGVNTYWCAACGVRLQAGQARAGADKPWCGVLCRCAAGTTR